MQQLQLFFEQSLKLKHDAKEIKASIADALKSSREYQKKLNEYEIAKSEINMIKRQIEEEFTKDFDKLTEIKIEIDEKDMAITDTALASLMKGEIVELEYNGQKYEASWKVKFKKIK